jgi:hypothetical protein
MLDGNFRRRSYDGTTGLSGAADVSISVLVNDESEGGLLVLRVAQ